MKKLIFLLLVFAGFMACENEIIEELPQEVSKTEGISAKQNNKVDVCHKGEIINVNVNSLSGHQGHGDGVDMDGDGYFDIDNGCSETDCDDTTYNSENLCCTEAYEIDFEGPLFVALADEFAQPQRARTAEIRCAQKALADGCDWRLPTLEELNAIYGERVQIGGFNPIQRYWSADENSAGSNWYKSFSNGSEGLENSSINGLCRCVHN